MYMSNEKNVFKSSNNDYVSHNVFPWTLSSLERVQKYFFKIYLQIRYFSPYESLAKSQVSRKWVEPSIWIEC